jgi:hypothetical protein
VIFALMSFLIAVGVVILLGAIVGVVWRERHPPKSHPPDSPVAPAGRRWRIGRA